MTVQEKRHKTFKMFEIRTALQSLVFKRACYVGSSPVLAISSSKRVRKPPFYAACIVHYWFLATR